MVLLRKKLLVYFLIFLFITLPISFAQQTSYLYDGNGNLLQDESNYYEYNGFDQLIRVRLAGPSGTIIAEYSYDHEGNRIFSQEYSVTQNTTTYYPDDNFVQVVNSTGTYNTTYYYGNGILLAADAGSMSYYHPDHLGSTTLVTDAAGNVLRETRHAPFGALLSGGNDRYLYTGQELDLGTGLYYYGARYYKQNLYHFTQPDHIIVNVYDPQSLNRYSYVMNNPYKYVDDNGDIAFLVTAVIGAGVGLAAYFLTHDPSTYNFGDAGLYALGGAIAGGLGVLGISYAIAGSIVSTLLENHADEKKTTIIDIVLSGVPTAGIGKYAKKILPYAPHHLIKKPLSYITTKTGKTFISNQMVEQSTSKIIEESGSALLNYYESSTNSDSSSQTSSYDNLRAIVEANTDKTAAEIIADWRAQYG